MACCGINSKDVSYVDAPCQVCIDDLNDDSVKKVFWCETCKAYICANHRTDAIARGKSAVKSVVRKTVNFIKGL